MSSTGRPLLGRKTGEKLNVLRVGPENVLNSGRVLRPGHPGELC